MQNRCPSRGLTLQNTSFWRAAHVLEQLPEHLHSVTELAEVKRPAGWPAGWPNACLQSKGAWTRLGPITDLWRFPDELGAAINWAPSWAASGVGSATAVNPSDGALDLSPPSATGNDWKPPAAVLSLSPSILTEVWLRLRARLPPP